MKAAATLGLISIPMSILAAWGYILAHPKQNLPDPEFLASDLFFQIGDVTIPVPAVAVSNVRIPPDHRNPLPRRSLGARGFATGEYKTALAGLAADPLAPANVSSIRLWLGVYGSFGEHILSSEICPLLTKEWSRKACKDTLRKELKNLPFRFHLTTEAGLSAFKGYSFAGVDAVRANQVMNATIPISHQSTLTCKEDTRFCRAAMLIADNVYAVWSQSCKQRSGTDCTRNHVAEGVALTEFIRNQLAIGRKWTPQF